ncbi:MAG: hypothetical protein UH249_03515, partial [Acutalibacteraceae bacterium]|nr:hypothetical protein [Acutalibacteraceae bacterium]
RDTFRKNIEISLFSLKISPSHDFVVPAPFRQGGLISAPLKNTTTPNLPAFTRQRYYIFRQILPIAKG